MSKMISMLAIFTATLSSAAAENCNSLDLKFTELPYSEGTLYVAVSCNGTEIHKSAAEVDSDLVTIHIDMPECEIRQIEIKAFQDMNDNMTLDFDSYGRPVEPCLQTEMTVKPDDTELDLQLIQY